MLYTRTQVDPMLTCASHYRRIECIVVLSGSIMIGMVSYDFHVSKLANDIAAIATIEVNTMSTSRSSVRLRPINVSLWLVPCDGEQRRAMTA